ncbi:MAG TPA: phosphodiester glycosidase family protein [Candidatus Limnocylindrales bacterium]|nr:phosphodiester glycosidase family protein [Candidatus Limnocylindrales bacterium]
MVSLSLAASGWSSGTNVEPNKFERWFSYTNVVIDDIPWSIHIVKLDRSSRGFEFVTTLGRGTNFGMGTVSEQLKALPRELGQPLAAINGDFYDKSEKYEGRPRDLQIYKGEVVSSPAGHTCFWVAPGGSPQMTNVYSRFRVIWPDGKSTPISLNQARADDAAVLYTWAIGNSTRTIGGAELILESTNRTGFHPLRIGNTIATRVREIRANGDCHVEAGTMVLSVGPGLTSTVPVTKPGAILHIVTETVPDLTGVSVAIGGGPALVHGGKPMHWSGFLHMRHPRSAVGWNKDYIYLVEVDGRQSNISLGMTFPELADYLIKLGCSEAANLDGGGSATLWALGSVRNSPSEGDERPSANALVVIRRKSN